MSSNPQRRPSRTAPRPPRPSFPPSSIQRCDPPTSTPRSSLPTLSTNSDSRSSLPDYHVHSSQSSPHEIRRHRRGSDGDSHPRRPVPSQRPRKRSQTVRSKSVRQRSRPQITFVSAEPMSHHPAFADGAKGSYIPPEAPPSYDEAMKAPLPRNPSFTDPAFPDHISQRRRVFPTVESVSLPTSHSEEETQPKTVIGSARPNPVPTRDTTAEQLIVQLPIEGTSPHSSPGSSRESLHTSLNPAQPTDEERHPVPTPRTRRKVSLHRNSPPSTSELTNNTTLKPNHPIKPPIPPKKPHLTSPTSPTTSHQHFQSSTTSPDNHSQPDLLSSLQDSSNCHNLPVPMLPSSRKLPPPPRPPSGPRKTLPEVNEKNDHESVETTSKVTSSIPPETSLSNIPASVPTDIESNEAVDEVEPVYAKVHKVAKNTAADDTRVTNSDTSPSKKVPATIVTNRAETPPLVPTTRPPMEDYEGILFNSTTDQVSHSPKQAPKQPENSSLLTTSDVNSTHVSPSSSIDSLYESVRFHKNTEESKTQRPQPRPKPTEAAPRHPVNPPPLPASRPVGHIPKGSTPPPGGRRQSSGDVPKREKNGTSGGKKVVRRKSTNFKEKGLKLFRQRNHSEGVEKTVSEPTSHFYTAPSPKPKKVPPPRPAPPSVLQRKITEPSLTTQVKEEPQSTLPTTSSSPQREKAPESPTFSLGPAQSSPEVKPEPSPTTKPSRPLRPPPNRPPPIKAPTSPPAVSTPAPVEKHSTNGDAPPLPKPRRQPPKGLAISNDLNNVVEVEDKTDNYKSNENVVSPQETQKPLVFDLKPLVSPSGNSEACDLTSSPPRSPSAGRILSPPGSAKLKPSRPPPALLSTPLLPLHVTQKRPELVEKQPEEIQPQVDEQMKNYVDGEQFYIAVEDYEPTNFTDLSFGAGEKVSVMKRIDDVTLFGRNEEGEEGTFPEKYVRLEAEIVDDKNDKLPVVQSNANNNNSNNINNHFLGQHQSGEKVTALFGYTSTNPEDLTFKAGDVICVEEHVSSDWIKGRIGDMTGIFPKSFVKPAPAGTMASPQTALKKQHGIAKFDFAETNSDELTFKAGDKIELLGKINPEWMRGKLGNKIGIFPVNYVETKLLAKPAIEFPKPLLNNISKSKGQFVLPEKADNHVVVEQKCPTATALFDFTGKDSSELTFKVNDIIKITKKVNEDWFEGELNKQTGIFPANFVQL